MRIVLLVIVLLGLTAAPARALETYSYLVEGVTTLTGNPVCAGGRTCVQGIAFSFVMEYAPVILDGQVLDSYRPVWAASDSVASFGPLQPFTVAAQTHWTNYVALVNAGGDEIDLTMSLNTFLPMAPFDPPLLTSSQLWGCRSAVCQEHFAPSPGATFGLPVFGPIAMTSRRIAMSEPETWLLLALGLGGLLVYCASRSHCSRLEATAFLQWKSTARSIRAELVQRRRR
jgi:hypothetical protein